MSYDPILKDSSIVKIWGRYISLPLVSGIESEIDFDYSSSLNYRIAYITYYVLSKKILLEYTFEYDTNLYSQKYFEMYPDGLKHLTFPEQFEIIHAYCLTEETKNKIGEFDKFIEAWKAYHNKLGAINAK